MLAASISVELFEEFELFEFGEFELGERFKLKISSRGLRGAAGCRGAGLIDPLPFMLGLESGKAWAPLARVGGEDWRGVSGCDPGNTPLLFFLKKI